MEVNSSFWKNRSVFVTGHTGFKGGWISLWLSEMGAIVHGFSLDPPTIPNFFENINIKKRIKTSVRGDIRDLTALKNSMQIAKPSVIFHMAAQSLVRHSYDNPIDTFATNLMGTINVLEAARQIETLKAIINITTDKCYENKELNLPFKEIDRLGGRDPYSSSKACSEIVTSSYRTAFFSETKIRVATARAGNIIGGGDWAIDRLVPDLFRSIKKKETLYVRSPKSIRPWQHVLDPLSGYLLLAENLVTKGNNFAEAWNFGPDQSSARTVSWVLNEFSKKIKNLKWKSKNEKKKYESILLKLDISKAKSKLGWMPKWPLENAIDNTINWYQAFNKNENMEKFSIEQIKLYLGS